MCFLQIQNIFGGFTAEGEQRKRLLHDVGNCDVLSVKNTTCSRHEK